MAYKRKFSLFISSTYEDLKEERQALMGVALESGYIPVGMEQFHAAPASQWNVITKMIDECDFYLLVIGGRYGSIDETVDKSYTEKEYDYAKSKGIPILVLLKNQDSITADKMDYGEDRYDKQRKLEEFRNKVKTGGNTVDFFGNLNGLKYAASQTLTKSIEYADSDAGWVRYSDVVEIINESVEATNKANAETNLQQQEKLDSMKTMLSAFGDRLTELENNQHTWKEIPTTTNEDISKLFRIEGETMIIGNPKE